MGAMCCQHIMTQHEIKIKNHNVNSATRLQKDFPFTCRHFFKLTYAFGKTIVYKNQTRKILDKKTFFQIKLLKYKTVIKKTFNWRTYYHVVRFNKAKHSVTWHVNPQFPGVFGKFAFPYHIEKNRRPKNTARARICDLLLLADKEFYEKDANSSLNHVVRRMMHAVAQADIIFRNADFNEDGVPDNIGWLSFLFAGVWSSFELGTLILSIPSIDLVATK